VRRGPDDIRPNDGGRSWPPTGTSQLGLIKTLSLNATGLGNVPWRGTERDSWCNWSWAGRASS
jgi:hypothetical protein